MRKKQVQVAFGRRTVTGLIALFIFISVVTAIWDYTRVQQLTTDLAIRQARGLIHQIRRQVALVTQGDRIVRASEISRLVGVADLLAAYSSLHEMTEINWDNVALLGEVSHIKVFDEQGKIVAGTLEGPELSTQQCQGLLEDLLFDDDGVIETGMYSVGDSGATYLGIATVFADGGMFVGADASRLINWRRNAGLTAALEDLEGNPSLDYAVIESRGQILAATTTLPAWVGTDSDPFVIPDTLRGLEARVAVYHGDTVFEAVTPLDNYPGVYLRLGIATGELEAIRSRNIISLVLRTALFTLLGVVILVWFVTREHHLALRIEAERIRTEVERLESSRAASERLEAMGKLAGGVAHEIRNPLNTIEMVSQRLVAEFEPRSDREEYVTLVQAMRKESGRIGRIVEDFLQLARPPKADKRADDIKATVEEVITLFAPTARGKGVKLESELSAIPPFAFDRTHVSAAVLNLLRNANDAVEEKSGTIKVSLAKRNKDVVVEVVDNGPGIPKSERSRIFHLYYTTKAEGTGVGLAFVHRIADEHGGYVEVDDTPGGGATFRLILKREKT